MNTPCPHCQAQIEIDPETHATLQGHAHFQCPSCSGLVPVPAMRGPQPVAPVKVTAAAAIRPTKPSPMPTSAHRGMNRNLLIFGSMSLLLLGGLGFFIASQKSDETRKTEKRITHSITNNMIVDNKFFANLIATGATTAKDLEAVTRIEADEAGFIGMSKEKITWQQARDLAMRTGARILEPGVNGSDERKRITDKVTQSFPDLLGTSVWVAENGQPRVIDSPDVNPVTTLDRPRHVFMQWAAWRTVVSTTFDESSPFGTNQNPSWTSALEGGFFTLRRTDSGVLWLGAGNARAGSFTSIRTRARISNSGIFAERAPRAVLGLLFRVSGSGYYAVEIRGDGYWQFYVRKDKMNHPLSPWEFSEAVRPAGDFNDVVVEALGPRFRITVNGKELGSFENDGLAAGGHSLLFASNGNAFYEFDRYELLEKKY